MRAMNFRLPMRLAVVLLALLFSMPGAAYHEADEPSDGTVASFMPVDPPFALAGVTFADAAGKPIALSDFAGKVVLLNLWATWCPPCVRELPALDRLAGRLGGESFAVVALALDSGGAAVAAPYFERLGIEHLPLYVDSARAIGEVLPDDVLPASYFLDRQGRVVSFLRSFVDWDDPRADALVRDLIATE
ncbi:MAG: TlpA family protein disulfide reductase [Gammaproteobacteria bacterium]|nr:MAG: TlpA family protein disulfide reductase [Gammaproteobacteria bacterium]